ncbi:hypothetical protein AAU57_14740 [Nonlabens sp. YIK11]|nr:hypothetical protein AAU57_14740 [Nonlabens sp. YIK11]
MEGLEKIYRDGYSYKKAGLVAMDLAPGSDGQLAIFSNADPRHSALMSMIAQQNDLRTDTLCWTGSNKDLEDAPGVQEQQIY